MSQPSQNQNKRGGMLRALLWAVGLGVFAGLVGYVAALGLSAILSYGSGGNFIVAHVLDTFNYTEAANAVRGIALNQLYQANSLPYVVAIAGAGLGAVIGYFKGKSEDSE